MKPYLETFHFVSRLWWVSFRLFLDKHFHYAMADDAASRTFRCNIDVQHFASSSSSLDYFSLPKYGAASHCKIRLSFPMMRWCADFISMLIRLLDWCASFSAALFLLMIDSQPIDVKYWWCGCIFDGWLRRYRPDEDGRSRRLIDFDFFVPRMINISADCFFFAADFTLLMMTPKMIT